MSLSHLLKSRLTLSTLLRKQEVSYYSGSLDSLNRAIQMQQAPKIRADPYNHQQHLYSEAVYIAVSKFMISFPLFASIITLANLAEDQYYYEVAYYEFMTGCQRIGIQLSDKDFEEYRHVRFAPVGKKYK